MMKHHRDTPHVLVWCVLLVLQVSITWAQQAEVLYSFGKIERLSPKSDAWEFVKRGMTLQQGDLVRMPPISILRLRTTKGDLLPALTGAREITVAHMVAEAHRKLQRQSRPRIVDPLQGEAPVDVIPTAAAVIKADRPPQRQTHWAIDTQQLQAFRRAMALISPQTRKQAALWRSQLASPPYGSPEVQIAREFYRRVFVGNEPSSLEEAVRAYLQLLTAAGIDLELQRTREGDLIVCFDTAIQTEETRKLTANAQLTRQQGEHLWLPLSIAPLTSFIEAWYEGAKIWGTTQEAEAHPR